MSTHTHTFEIEFCEGPSIKGELLMNGTNSPPSVFITTELDLSLVKLKRIEKFLQEVVSVYHACGEIEKIEINKK